MESDSVFSLPQQLENVWHGIDKFDLSQIIPEGGVPNNSIVGQGNASGNMIFQWTENASWWSPVNSYFYFKFQFVKYTAPNTTTAIPTWNTTLGRPNIKEFVTYADNFVSTLFSEIRTEINNDPIDTITQPWVIDQVMTYSNAKKNFLDTFGSLARVGEPLMKRISNVYNNGTGVLEVCYRPPCSIFSVNLLPPGAQHRVTFTWAGSAINAFESLIGSISVGTTTGDYNIIVNDAKFYKATCNPSPLVPLPQHGVIELSRCSIKQHYTNATNAYQQTITLDDTTNRIYLTFQDIAQLPRVAAITAVNSPLVNGQPKYMGYGTGWNPITSFAKAFTSNAGNGTQLVELSNLYVNIDDLSLVLPKPVYKFQEDNSDWNRAYMDWATMSVGTKYNDTGSVPFGYNIGAFNTGVNFVASAIPGANLSVLVTDSVGTSVFQQGIPENPQNAVVKFSTDVANDPFVVSPAIVGEKNALFFQTCEYGWSGRHPGPIFAFNICRPVGVKLSRGTINVTFTGAVNNVVISVVCCSSGALAVQKVGPREYSYQKVSGI